MLGWLWPVHTGKTLFDVWTVMHLSFWIFMGSNLWSFKVYLPKALVLGLVFSFAWEFLERIMEPRFPEIWLTPESWVNAYVSDPLTSVLGIAFAYFALNNWRVP